jgi:tetratricopeptide (TPR) repeat protein
VPKAAEPRAELAGLLAREGRAADAVSAAESALALDAANREAHRVLGHVQAAVADSPASAATAPTLIAQAIRHLEQALADGKSDPGSRLLLARLYARTAQYEKAMVALKTFLAEYPGYPEALLIAGDAAERLGRWDEAAAAWSEISGLGTAGRPYRERLVAALINGGSVARGSQELGDASRAVASLERAAAAAPGVSVVHAHLGDVYMQVSRYADAVAAFDRALAGDRQGVAPAEVTRKRDRARIMAGK